ncbi:MAG: Txe/YoeB family addiction module toxin [Ruminococcus sp.]|jgi:toxin YoeB|nr:Txe/YoeB family addiction module toxin [Ruminococcus sp.]
MRRIIFDEESFDQYSALEKTLKSKAAKLIKDIQRNGHTGIGHPEQLSGDKAGYWSRRIDKKNRIVYDITDTEATFYSFGGHYDDK